jgi:hypothetical protein
MPGSNFFNTVPQEIQIPFQAYHDAQKAGGEVPGIFPKLPHQVNLFLVLDSRINGSLA